MKLNAKTPLTFSALVRRWPKGSPLIALGGRGRRVIVATDFSEVGYDELKQRTLVARPRPADEEPFRSGWMGLLSYDASAPHRVFRVERALVQDLATGVVEVQDADVELARRLIDGEETSPPQAGIDLVPEDSEARYLEAVDRALADILAGRFYQINLLRYFRARGDLTPELLAARLDRMGGPHAAVFEIPGLSLWSFSPERFIRLAPEGDELVAETRPIKGTIPRGATPDEDRRAAEALLRSPKDRAELHMIVDLMRNDLARVSRRRTVTVTSPGHLLTVENVHHLEAAVTSRLRPAVTFGELIEATCPGGSVTGAPKVEVMRAIREAEGRDRGYFMGNAFYLDDSGAFDSSILIRTLVRRDGQKGYEFAAGSGIVVKSQSTAESREIDAKARVLTASWN